MAGKTCLQHLLEVQGERRHTMTNTPSDAEIKKLAAEHIKAFAQFTGAGDVWVEGEVAFARAVLASGAHHSQRPIVTIAPRAMSAQP